MTRPFPLPGARPRYARDRVVDVQHIKLVVRVDPKERRISGRCLTTVVPIRGDVRVVELDAAELQIHDVKLEGSGALSYHHDGEALRIDLGAPRKGPLVLDIGYSGSPRRGIYFTAPDTNYPDRPEHIWTQGQDEDSRYWFPCFDQPNEKATTEVIATVPAPFFALSNGTLVDQKESPGTRTFHWKLDVPHSCYLVTLAAGDFAELTDRWQDVDVRYYVARGREEDAKRAMGRTPEMLALFSERFGLRYPYPKYAQVCVADFIFGGMENTTATTLTDNALFDARAALDYDVEGLVAHELAHQWFGDLLTCRDWGQGWLNEGFATYSEYVWREHAHGRDEASVELAGWADSYFAEDAGRYRRPITMNLYDLPIDIFDHHLYDKGGLVLHMLRQVLGDGEFWRAIGHYVHKHQTGSVETRDLARAIEEATGRNVDWFVDQWIFRAGHPELRVDVEWDADAGVAKVAVKQTQKVEGDTPLFRIPTAMRFRIGGKDVDRPLEITDVAETFFFPLPSAPTQAIFDPGGHVLKKVEHGKSAALWKAELEGATDAADRTAAARALARAPSADAISALTRALGSDRFWGVRAAAADSLGALRQTPAREALVSALGTEKHPKARRAIARALGEYREDDLAAAALERVVKTGDASYFVEAEASLALGRTRSGRAAAALRTAVGRDSYLDVIRSHAYRGLAEARDDEALPILLDGTRLGRISQGRRAAIQALATLASGRRDRLSRDARERIEDLLADPDFRVQQTAIEGLATLGDPAATGALRRVIDQALDGRLIRRSREVIRDLEEGRGRVEAEQALRDEVERLRRDLGAMQERLAKLETGGKTAVVTPARKPAPVRKAGSSARKATPPAKKTRPAAKKPRRR